MRSPPARIKTKQHKKIIWHYTVSLELHTASQSSCKTLKGMPLKPVEQKAQNEAMKWMESQRFSEFLVLSSNILAFLSRHTTQRFYGISRASNIALGKESNTNSPMLSLYSLASNKTMWKAFVAPSLMLSSLNNHSPFALNLEKKFCLQV